MINKSKDNVKDTYHRHAEYFLRRGCHLQKLGIHCSLLCCFGGKQHINNRSKYDHDHADDGESIAEGELRLIPHRDDEQHCCDHNISPVKRLEAVEGGYKLTVSMGTSSVSATLTKAFMDELFVMDGEAVDYSTLIMSFNVGEGGTAFGNGDIVLTVNNINDA